MVEKWKCFGKDLVDWAVSSGHSVTCHRAKFSVRHMEILISSDLNPS